MQEIGKAVKRNKGETLLEVVISIAFFAITVSMVTICFSAANQITMDNYDARETLNHDLMMVNSVSSRQEAGTVAGWNETGTRNVTYKIVTPQGATKTGQMNVYYVKLGAFTKFLKNE